MIRAICPMDIPCIVVEYDEYNVEVAAFSLFASPLKSRYFTRFALLFYVESFNVRDQDSSIGDLVLQ